MLQKINFAKGFESEDEARKVVAQVQKAMDEVVAAKDGAILAGQEANKLIEQYEEHTKTLIDSNINMSEILKNIHLALGQKKELFGEDAGMKALMDSLATFVVSSGAIKLGVLANARGLNNEQD